MKFQRPQMEEPSVELTPLIDVVFLLLIFFMVSTTFTRESRLSIDLPEASTEPTSGETRVGLEISITQNGEFAVNDQTLVNSKAATLRAALRKIGGSDTSQPVLISADANAPHQAVVTAMDVAGQLGFTHLRIATLVEE